MDGIRVFCGIFAGNDPPVVNQMMKNSFSLCFLTFICFVVIGYSTSTLLFLNSNNNADVTTSTSVDKNVEPIHTLKNGQRNILLVRVDSIQNENPALQGVWLLTYLPTESNLNFLPVFPKGSASTSESENRLTQSFSIVRENGKLNLSQKFTDELEKDNYWWSGYLVFDQSLQERVLGFFTGTYKSNNTNQGDQTMQALPAPLDDAHGAFSDQLSTIKTACGYLSSPNTDWSKLIFLMSNQFYSDLDMEQLLADWNLSATSKRTLTCQFPTLQQQVNANYKTLLTSVMK